MSALPPPVDVRDLGFDQRLQSAPAAETPRPRCQWMIDTATDRLVCRWSVANETTEAR